MIFTMSILENYEVFNSLKGYGEPAKWDYYLYNLDGHMKTISQKGSFLDSKTVKFILFLGFASYYKKSIYLRFRSAIKRFISR